MKQNVDLYEQHSPPHPKVFVFKCRQAHYFVAGDGDDKHQTNELETAVNWDTIIGTTGGLAKL